MVMKYLRQTERLKKVQGIPLAIIIKGRKLPRKKVRMTPLRNLN